MLCLWKGSLLSMLLRWMNTFHHDWMSWVDSTTFSFCLHSKFFFFPCEEASKSLVTAPVLQIYGRNVSPFIFSSGCATTPGKILFSGRTRKYSDIKWHLESNKGVRKEGEENPGGGGRSFSFPIKNIYSLLFGLFFFFACYSLLSCPSAWQWITERKRERQLAAACKGSSSNWWETNQRAWQPLNFIFLREDFFSSSSSSIIFTPFSPRRRNKFQDLIPRPRS